MATRVAAQSPPPVQGTIAPEDTTRKVYAAAHVAIVAAIDGVEHVFRYAKDLFGGKAPAVDPLGGLREGTTVVVRETVDGALSAPSAPPEVDASRDEGVRVTEGIVTRIDRGRKYVTIRFDDGKKETLRLADRAAADAGKAVDPARTGEGLVTVSYPDETGKKVDRFFTKTK